RQRRQRQQPKHQQQQPTSRQHRHQVQVRLHTLPPQRSTFRPRAASYTYRSPSGLTAFSTTSAASHTRGNAARAASAASDFHSSKRYCRPVLAVTASSIRCHPSAAELELQEDIATPPGKRHLMQDGQI